MSLNTAIAYQQGPGERSMCHRDRYWLPRFIRFYFVEHLVIALFIFARINAAMPPIAKAPRLWQVLITGVSKHSGRVYPSSLPVCLADAIGIVFQCFDITEDVIPTTQFRPTIWSRSA